MKPFFSIIVPAFNSEDTISFCLESIINQTFKDYEIIIINDGSNDATESVCCEYTNKHSFIKYYYKKNGGLSDARNYGIDKANGQYFLFIDSDDIIHEKFCEILHNMHIKYNADIVSTEIFEFNNINEIDTSAPFSYNEIELKGIDILKNYFYPQKVNFIYHGLCMKSYKASLFSDLKFEVGRLHEDLYITYLLLEKSNEFIYIDAPYYFYFQNPKSICHNYTEKNFFDEYHSLIIKINYYSSKKEIFQELGYFITKNFIAIISKLGQLNDYYVIYKKDNRIKVWIEKNICRFRYFNFFDKILIIIKINFPFLYHIKAKIFNE